MPSTQTIRRRSALRPWRGSRSSGDGDTLLVGSAAAGFTKKPKFQLIAYSLS